MSYNDGYLSASYGNLVQTFLMSDVDPTCGEKDVSAIVKEHKRTNKIGGTQKTITQFTKNYKVFPGKNGSVAAGGVPVTVVTDIGTYTARMGGSVEDLVSYLCANKGQMYGPVYVITDRGREYGPFGPTSSSAP